MELKLLFTHEVYANGLQPAELFASLTAVETSYFWKLFFMSWIRNFWPSRCLDFQPPSYKHSMVNDKALWKYNLKHLEGKGFPPLLEHVQ